MVARQPGCDRQERRGRSAGAPSAGQRRRVLRAGVLGPFCAVLARHGARRDSSGLTRYANRGHLARAALEAVALPDARRARSDGERLRHSDQGAARRRRHGRRTSCSCSSKRTCSACPSCGRASPRRRRSARRMRRASPSATGRTAPSSCATGASSGAGIRRWRSGERNKLYAAWQKAVQRSFDWVDGRVDREGETSAGVSR